jgi:hypothetical protein
VDYLGFDSRYGQIFLFFQNVQIDSAPTPAQSLLEAVFPGIRQPECEARAYHVTRHNTPIHSILSTAHQLSISQKALGTLPEDGSVMPKYVGGSIHN